MSDFALLRDPISNQPLQRQGDALVGTGTYPIINGIPRFGGNTRAVESFGDEWNAFNYDDFRANWIEHCVGPTFGGLEAFRDKVIVDAGAGSGMHTRWMIEAGARKVYALELSHSVDGVMQHNLRGLNNVSIIQCSIDAPPLAEGIADIVYCYNVIQHTQSVERTARALFKLVKPGGELVFSCYRWNTGPAYRGRRVIYEFLRARLSKWQPAALMRYSRIVAALRLIPAFGYLLEASAFVVRGKVPKSHSLRQRFKQAVLNTYDLYGSHLYQHFFTKEQLLALLYSLQPDKAKVLNVEKVFDDPAAKAAAFRVIR
jgi:2-polyprenyl-3-methyl-5-hydroxy-6-metoxy-1,4-benzoquinol methylase